MSTQRAACLGIALLLTIAVAAYHQRNHEKNGHDAGTVTAAPRGRWRLMPRSQLGKLTLWLSQLMMGHRDAQWPKVPFGGGDWFSNGKPPTRNREGALRLARDVAAKARSEPGDLAKLAKRYSEDAATRNEGGYCE